MKDSIRNNPVAKTLLMPFSWLYGGIMDLRNILYDRGIFNTESAPAKTISIGNLSVGGTGKTPMTELLIRLLKDKYKIVVISRGYGRKTRGLLVARPDSRAEDIGDEPLQYYSKFQNEINVIVAEKRTLAAEKIRSDFRETGLILLDDAYQHRAIARDLNIMLTDFSRPFYSDYPFPAGNLRENRKGAARADLIVVTKAPLSLDEPTKLRITGLIHAKTEKSIPVFFSSVRYGAPVPFDGDKKLPARLAGLAGLANNAPFRTFLEETYGIEKFISFSDHHVYNETDLLNNFQVTDENTGLLTTEKDYVKLLPLARALGNSQRCFYIPIETVVHEETGFLRIISEFLQR